MPSNRPLSATPFVALLVALLAAFVYGPHVQRTVVVMGVFRKPVNTIVASENQFTALDKTTHCEDLHYHAPSKLLFTACENNPATRHSWFPPLSNFDDQSVTAKSRGALKVIDPSTLQVRTLEFQNFDKPFVTHGIDVIDDPDRPQGKAVYIFAVNHRPNPEHFVKNDLNAPESYSVVEVFHYIIGSTSTRHVRSVWDPLIQTPNDVLGLSPTTFFVTNDHHYRKGPMRMLEDMYAGAKWSNTIFVDFSDDASGSTPGDNHGVKASVALEGLHNNNGLGRGRTPEDILVGSAASGLLHYGRIVPGSASNSRQSKIEILRTVEINAIVDNPSYFFDPYADATFDASGVVICGLSKAIHLHGNIRDPAAKDAVMVFAVREAGPSGSTPVSWNKTLLFEDDGSRIRSGSSAVLIAADPSKAKGRRRGRLFATGFLSKSIIVLDIDL